MKLSPIAWLLLLFATVAWPVAASGTTSGAELFADNCAPCHGLDGKGRTPAGKKVGAKDLTQSKLSDAEIEKQILNGTKNERGAEKMPSFRQKLAAADISLLVTYVKTFRH